MFVATPRFRLEHKLGRIHLKMTILRARIRVLDDNVRTMLPGHGVRVDDWNVVTYDLLRYGRTVVQEIRVHIKSDILC